MTDHSPTAAEIAEKFKHRADDAGRLARAVLAEAALRPASDEMAREVADLAIMLSGLAEKGGAQPGTLNYLANRLCGLAPLLGGERDRWRPIAELHSDDPECENVLAFKSGAPMPDARPDTAAMREAVALKLAFQYFDRRGTPNAFGDAEDFWPDFLANADDLLSPAGPLASLLAERDRLSTELEEARRAEREACAAICDKADREDEIDSGSAATRAARPSRRADQGSLAMKRNTRLNPDYSASEKYDAQTWLRGFVGQAGQVPAYILPDPKCRNRDAAIAFGWLAPTGNGKKLLLTGPGKRVMLGPYRHHDPGVRRARDAHGGTE